MSDSTGFRGDASDKTLVSLLVLLEEIHLTDSLGLASVGGDGWGGGRDDVIDRTKLLTDQVLLHYSMNND